MPTFRRPPWAWHGSAYPWLGPLVATSIPHLPHKLGRKAGSCHPPGMCGVREVLTAIRRTDAFTEVHLSCLRSMTKMNPMPASCKLKQGETLGVSICWQQTGLPQTPVTPLSHAISTPRATVHARERSQQPRASKGQRGPTL